MGIGGNHPVRKSRKQYSQKPFFVAMGAVILVGLYLLMSRSPPEHHPIPKPEALPAASAPAPSPAFEKAKKMRKDREALTRALEKAARGDPRGDILIAFHEKNAFYSVLVGGGVTMRMGTSAEELMEERPNAFEVTIATPEERIQNGLRADTAASWDTSRNELFLPPIELMTEEWAGVLFAHELSHAYDIVTGNEPRELPFGDRRFIRGEARAYEMELRLLDRMTHGKYRQVIRDRLEARGLLGRKRSGTSVAMKVLQKDRDEVNRLFPPARSGYEQAARDGMTEIAFNFIRIEAAKGGDKEKEEFLQELYGKIMR